MITEKSYFFSALYLSSPFLCHNEFFVLELGVYDKRIIFWELLFNFFAFLYNFNDIAKMLIIKNQPK